MYVCGKYDKRCDDADLKVRFPNIPDLLERLNPGGTVPAGECPGCGALVCPEDEPTRLLILFEGGLVQDVLADHPDVEPG